MRSGTKKASLTHHERSTKSWLDYSGTWLMQLPMPPSSLIVAFISSASYTGHVIMSTEIYTSKELVLVLIMLCHLPVTRRVCYGPVVFCLILTQRVCRELFSTILGSTFVYEVEKNNAHSVQVSLYVLVIPIVTHTPSMKNRSGGIDQLQMENKSVRCVAVPENRPICLVYLLDKYLSKLPRFAYNSDILYCRAKPNCPANESAAWYERSAVGKNKLSLFVSEMCSEAGIPRRSNHSLRSTGASVMFQSHVPEKIIQKTIGHRSLKGM